MWFCRHDDAALRHFARGLDPATFRSWGFELGPRSHPHSEEWMCFLEPDASFRDLQRLTASHGHVPACPILARHEGFPHERLGGVVALSSTPIDHHCETRCYPARRPGSRPSPLRPEGRSPPTLSRWRHDSRACRSTASKGKEGAQADFGPLVRPERSTPKDVDPFVTSPATVCTVQSLLDSLPNPSCRA